VSTAAFLVSAGFLVAWLPLGVRGFRLVRAREGHGAFWMQTTGTTMIAVKRRGLVCMWMLAGVAAARTCCCTLLLYGTTDASIKIVDIGSTWGCG
jgi:hypothetical protein